MAVPTMAAPVMVAAQPPEVRDAEVGEFFARHHSAIRRFLVTCGCPEHEADDIVQDTILAVRERWHHVRTLEKPTAYWYMAARRRLQRVQGRLTLQQARNAGYQDRLLIVPDPVDAPGIVDRRRALLDQLRELPLGQRQVLWLRLAEGFSEAETARILDVCAGTVKSQLHDAKKNLKEQLRKNGGTWEADIL